MGEGLFIAGTGAAGLPPVLDKVAISVAKHNAAEKAAAETKEKAAKKATDSTKAANVQLKDLESWATRSALKVDLLAGSLLYMVDVALRGAMALERFTLATGIQPRVLQQAQGAGVRVGIGPDEMAQFVTSMQSAAVQMRMTGAGAPQWGLLSQMLGVPLFPGEDPRRLIADLHRGLMRLRGDQIPFAREIAAQAGISENVFQGLRNPEFATAGFMRMYDVTQRNLGNMNKLNAEWETLKFGVSATGQAFTSQFTPLLTGAVTVLTSLVGLLARFVGWLDRGSVGATIMKLALGAVAVAIGAAAIALTGFAAAMAYAAIAAGALSLGLAPVLGTVLAIAAAVGLAVGGLTALGLIHKDLEVGERGGKSAIPAKNRAAVRLGMGAIESIAFGLPAGSIDLFKGAADLFRSPGSSSSHSTTVHQTVTIPVTAAAGREGVAAMTIKDALSGLLNQAAYGAPAPSR